MSSTGSNSIQEETAYSYMKSKVILTMKFRMMNLYLTTNDTDWSHQIGKARAVGGNRKSRPIILKFARYMVQRSVLSHGKN